MKETNKLEEWLIYGILILLASSLIFIFYSTLRSSSSIPEYISKEDKMGFTFFDKQLAKEFMDKNNDDMCDACGMSIESCIESGMMECSMAQDAKIGILHSQHIHADWKIYINSNMLNEEFFEPFADAHEAAMKDPAIKTTSSFIHVHEVNENNDEKVGDVLHMHATGVQLWLFSKSVNLEFQNPIKLYVNGKLNPEGLNYTFKDQDKLLLTDSIDETEIKQQIESITNYASEHSKS